MVGQLITNRIRASEVVRDRIIEYIKRIPNDESSYECTDNIYWDAEKSLKNLQIDDLDLSLSLGHISNFTIKVHEEPMTWLESFMYGGIKYSVEYSLSDDYDFEEFKKDDKNALVVWINNNMGYDLQENGSINTYKFACSGQFIVYAY